MKLPFHAREGRDARPAGVRPRSIVPIAALAAAASGLIGWEAAGHHAKAAEGPPARLAKVVHPVGTGSGVTVVDASGKTSEIAEGGSLPCGSALVTDPRTRARLELADGSVVALDRDTRLTYGGPHTFWLANGSIVADAGVSSELVVGSPLAELRTTGGRYALTADDRRASVGVARGDVVMHRAQGDDTVHPGEEAEVTQGAARAEITATGDLGQRIAFGESFDASKDDDEGPPSGLGELRARKPGSKDEIDGAVRLVRHQVKARIAGSMARTEVDETFANTTDKELEGLWRFPLPEGARLERLALEVDGNLVEGEFVDAKRAAGIWRGVIQNAVPTAPKPVEEIVWVPGPWRDPALLEWQRGGRAELKIFPIPRHGTRRVVLAYTQHVEPAGGMRRYVYPLATRAGVTPIDEASFDVRVVGADASVGVRPRGYELTSATGDAPEPGGATSLAMSRTSFTPAGDLVVEYATPDRTSEASAVGFTPGGSSEDGFVAIALRPRLPASIAERGRDQVVVVDTGRSMVGERLRRASRLAVQMAQQMDRRDRLTVLACDLECRAMPGGWHSPGAASAHDVDAFLAGVTADGASDLAGAVREAAAVSDRAADHDLRVVLLSDGVASAGVRGRSRLGAEIASRMTDPRGELVAVPVGSDADGETLAEIARGGGGVVVPYASGQSLDATALDVLAATYGATLRDVELTLPDGLRDVAPAELPSIRAGAETIVAARLHGDHAAGELVLRGKLAGEPFEARWPLDVTASSDEGNAWTARTWAAGRIADDERAGDDAGRTDAVALSHRFRVPSRTTSLLVLESEAMFHAFGVARAESAFEWTGESESHGTQVASDAAKADEDDVGSLEKGAHASAMGELSALGAGGGAGTSPYADNAAPAKRAAPRPAEPASTMAPPAAPPVRPSLQGGLDGVVSTPTTFGPSASAVAATPAPPTNWPRDFDRRRPGRWMRRVWFRTAAISTDARSPVDTAKLDAARAALATSPDLRQRHADLAKLLLRAGDARGLEDAANHWASRDPLDPDLLTVRASLEAWRGDREGAMRILSGVLSSPAASSSTQAEMASLLARAEERALRPAVACALRSAAAESKPDDVTAVAAAIACERGRGNEAAATRWLAGAKDDATRARISSVAAKTLATPPAEDALFGDVVVDATWDDAAGADLDVGIVDPSGKRLSWASASPRVRARDCTSRTHEALAVSSGAAGAFMVEIVRADGAGTSATPVRGKLRITSLGRTQVVPFVLGGDREPVARVDVRFDSRLEPISAWPAW